MQKVSDSVKKKYMSQVIPGEIYLVVRSDSSDSSDEVVYTASDWVSDSLSITEALCSKDTLDYSSVESNVLEVSLASEKGNIKQLVGKRIYCKQVVDGEEVPLGVYTIDEATLDGDYYTNIKAYDDIKKFQDTRISNWWNNQLSFPITLKSLLISLCKYVGIAYSFPATWCNSDFQIVQNVVFDEDAKASDLLGMIQELSGAFFQMNRSGIFEIVGHSVELTEIPYTDIMEDMTIADYKVKPIENVCFKNSDDDLGVSANDKENVYVISNNELIGTASASEEKALAQNILNSIVHSGYSPFSVEYKSYPFLTCGDWIKCRSFNGNEVSFWITNRKLSGDYLLVDSIEVKGNTNETSEKRQSNSKKITILNKKMHEFVNTIDEFRSKIESIETTYNGVVTEIEYYYLYNNGETPNADDPGWTKTPSAASNGMSIWEKKVVHYIDKEPSIVITNRTINNLVSVIPYYRLSMSNESLDEDVTYFGPTTFFRDEEPYTYFYDAGPWTESIPKNKPGFYRWIKFKFTYSDGTYSWSEPQCDQTFEDVYREITDLSTEISQTKEEIALKANEKDVKDYQSAITEKIEQEVTDRKAAIEETSKQISQEVKRVTDTKAQGFKVYRVSVREGETPTKSFDDYRWTTENVPWKDGYHIWMMTATIYTDEDIVYSEPTDISGADGQPGQQGIQGIQGVPGKDGINGADGKNGENGKDGLGIKSEKIEWKLSESSLTWESTVYTEWESTQPNWVENTYLWSKRTITYDDDSERIIYTYELNFSELYTMNKETSAKITVLDNSITSQAQTITTLTGNFDEYKKTTDAAIKLNSDNIGSITLEVSNKIERKDLDNMGLVNKNLVLQSNTIRQLSESGKSINYTLSEKTQSGEKYVFSVYGDFNYVTSMNIQVGSLSVKMYYSSKDDRYYCKFSPQSTGVNATNLYLYINLNQSGSNPIATITKVKLEKGTDITAWSQAPEDYATTIQMNSAIKQSADAISLEVSKKVGKDEIISAINMSAEGIGIQASKINLTFGSDKETMTLKGNTTGVLFDGAGCFEVDTVGGFNLENYSDSTKAHVRNDIYTSYSSTVQSLILRNMSYDFSKIANTISLSGYQSGKNNILLKNRGSSTISNDLRLESNGEEMTISLGNLNNQTSKYVNLARLTHTSTLESVFISNGLDSNGSSINYIYMTSTSSLNTIRIRNSKPDGTLAGSIEFYSNKSATSGQTLMMRGGNGNGDMWMGMSQDLALIRYSNYTDRFELNSSSTIMAHGSQSIYVTNSNGIVMYVGNQGRLHIDGGGVVNAYNGVNSGKVIVSTAIAGGDGMHPIAFGWSGSTLSAFVDNTNVWSTSDERLKKDIVDISEAFVNAIGSVNIKQFKFAVAPYDQSTIHFGVIAQELRNSLEENGCDLNNLCVTSSFKNPSDDTEYYSVDKEEFLMARIAYDEKRIKELESRLEKYEELRAS